MCVYDVRSLVCECVRVRLHKCIACMSARVCVYFLACLYMLVCVIQFEYAYLCSDFVH